MAFYYGASGDVREELGNPTESEYSGSLIERTRKKASALIDVALERTYPAKIPFASGDVPVIIDSLANDFATYYCLRAKHTGPVPLSEEKKEEYWDKPFALLESIAKREKAIPELTSSLKRKILSTTQSYSPVFDMDKPEDWAVDSDLKDKIADDRG